MVPQIVAYASQSDPELNKVPIVRGITEFFWTKSLFKIVAPPVLMESLTSISSSARAKEKARTEHRNSLQNIWLSLTNEKQKKLFKQATL